MNAGNPRGRLQPQTKYRIIRPATGEVIKVQFKPLEQLTLMDDYMFGAVMENPRLIKPLIEAVLFVQSRSLRAGAVHLYV